MVLRFVDLISPIILVTELSACTTFGPPSGSSSDEYVVTYQKFMTEFTETNDAVALCDAALTIGYPDAGALGTKSFRKKKYLEHILKSMELSPEQGLTDRTNACFLELTFALQRPSRIIKSDPKMLECMAKYHGFYEGFDADDFRRCAAELNYEP